MSVYNVQWYVSINGAFYTVCSLGPGLGWRLLQLQGQRPGARYDVQILDGKATCNCPDGLNQRVCKHLEALGALNGQV